MNLGDLAALKHFLNVEERRKVLEALHILSEAALRHHAVNGSTERNRSIRAFLAKAARFFYN